MKILKFACSLIDKNFLPQLAGVVARETAEDAPVWLVVPALKKCDETLFRVAKMACAHLNEWKDPLLQLEKMHLDLLLACAPSMPCDTSPVAQGFNDLRRILSGISALGELSDKVLDRVLSFGPLWGSHIIAGFLTEAGLAVCLHDPAALVMTDSHFGGAHVDYAATAHAVSKQPVSKGCVQIVPGGIGATPRGITTTLGRNGADFTATVLAFATGAKEVQFWTDSPGWMTADSSIVPQARPIEHMTYEEAMELSHFGSQTLHSSTLQPLMAEKIPLRIRNLIDRSSRGTTIDSRLPLPDERKITGISSISGISLLRVSGSGMVGVQGIAARLFRSLADEQINAILISQGASEHSICVAVSAADAEAAVHSVSCEFASEMAKHIMNAPAVEPGLCILGVVGENMRHRPGLSGLLFSALGNANINVIAIAQGSSELNISLVIDQKNEREALTVIHSAFFS